MLPDASCTANGGKQAATTSNYCGILPFIVDPCTANFVSLIRSARTTIHQPMHWTLLALLAAASARPQPHRWTRARLDIRGGASDAVATPTSLNELQLLCEKEEGVCVVDFGATWCGPCQRIAPVFDQLAEGCPDALFAKVDVDEVPDASQHYSVSALPTFLVFKDGKEVARIQGADEAGLRAALDKAGCPPPKNDIF